MPQRVTRSVTDDGGSTPDPPSGALQPRSGWYALRLQSNREFRVVEFLGEMGIEAYFPTWSEQVRWSDRTRTSTRPLFPGYVFVRPHPIHELLMITGVVQALPTNYEPSLIDEWEIENLKLALERGRDAKPAAQCPYEAGDEVTIDSGPLAGVSGVVTRTKGALRIVVAVKILNRAVSVELDASDLKREEKKAA